MSKPFQPKWEYCECGCKSCCVTILGLHFSYYDPLDSKRPYRFLVGHNARTFGQPRDSVEDINAEVLRLVSAQKEALKKEIAELET